MNAHDTAERLATLIASELLGAQLLCFTRIQPDRPGDRFLVLWEREPNAGDPAGFGTHMAVLREGEAPDTLDWGDYHRAHAGALASFLARVERYRQWAGAEHRRAEVSR